MVLRESLTEGTTRNAVTDNEGRMDGIFLGRLEEDSGVDSSSPLDLVDDAQR